MDDNISNDDFLGFDDSEVSDVDFFAVADGDETPDDESENPPGTEDTPKTKEELEKEEIKDDDLFGEADQDENEDEEDEEEEGKNKPESADEVLEGKSLSTLALLKEKGLVDYELEEGEKLTEEKASELVEDSLDTLFDDRISELFEDVPDIVKDMNKFVLKGGDINVFLASVAKQQSAGLTEDMDMDNEANQELVIRQGLVEEGYDEEYITAQIEFLKDSKRLKKHADTHFKKWDDSNKQAQANILASQEQAAKREKESRRLLKTKVSSFLKDTDEVEGFTVTPKDRKSLPDYMSDRTIKLQNGNQITNMQKDLMRVLNSPTGSVQIAKLLKSASEDGELNFKEIKQNTETKVTKKVRENVRRSKKDSIITKSGEGKTSRKLKLADYFD